MSEENMLLNIEGIELGIILFKRNTLLDYIICSITKQEFADIAIYYSNGISKHVITVNLLPNDNWFKRISYDEFLSQPMKNVALKKLKNNVKEFVISLIKTLKIMSGSNTSDFLTYLLGGTVFTNTPCCGVHMLNMIVKDMQCDYMFGDNKTISAKTVEELNRGMSSCDYYKSNVLYYLMSSITQLPNTHQLQRYIVKDGLFDEIEYIDCSKTEMIENYDDCEMLLAVFIEKLEDANFYNLVCNVVDTSRLENSKIIEKLIKTLYDTTSLSVKCIQEILNDATINDSSAVKSIIEKFTQECNTVARITNKKLEKITLANSTANNENNTNNENKESKENRESKSNVTTATVSKIYKDFASLVSKIRTDGTAEININDFIDQFNKLSYEYGIKQPNITHLSDKYTYTIIAKTKPEKQLKIKLNKKEIILTSKGALLDSLTRDELLEILEVIDSSDIDSFDDLRSRIVDKLAN